MHIMKKKLSILIPEYNTCCIKLVKSIQEQVSLINDLIYEIIVADDGSTNEKEWASNQSISNWSNCLFIRRDVNVGRAKIRNFLAQKAKYPWLLFIDCDMSIQNSDYISKYLQSEGDVIYGGYLTDNNPNKHINNLRYIYEKKAERTHTYIERRKNPYQDFHTSNFLIKREIMIRIPFDERFEHYGYEDVVFGRQLKENGIRINHINNPVIFEDFEDNEHFIIKTEEGLQTLSAFSNDLKGYSTLIKITTFLQRYHLINIIRMIYKITQKRIRKSLIGNHPKTFFFSFYKLGYFISIHKFH